MTAAEVKAALYRRHASIAPEGGAPGPWTCTEEWAGIDFLAFSAWSKPYPARARYSRVGYEVKVSRSDMRTELLRPGKRAHAVAFCNEFYFAVPAGLLKPDEIAYEEPAWENRDFQRVPCRFSYGGAETPEWNDDPGPCHKGKRQAWFVGPLHRRYPEQSVYRHHVEVKCEGCAGRGYSAKSRVEQEAPTLWIPADVGLVEIDGRGVNVVRPAPIREPVGLTGDPSSVREAHVLHQLVRWISWRPDPRHLEAHARVNDYRVSQLAGAPVDEQAEAV